MKTRIRKVAGTVRGRTWQSLVGHYMAHLCQGVFDRLIPLPPIEILSECKYHLAQMSRRERKRVLVYPKLDQNHRLVGWWSLQDVYLILAG